MDLNLKRQCVFNLLGFFKTPFKLLYQHEPLEIGRGIDFAVGLFVITFAPFKHTSGGFISIGIPMGLAIGASFITGGELLPITNDPKFTLTPPFFAREADVLKLTTA